MGGYVTSEGRILQTDDYIDLLHRDLDAAYDALAAIASADLSGKYTNESAFAGQFLQDVGRTP